MIFMSWIRFIALFILVFCLLMTSKPCFANWTLNLGYHNPPGSKFGVNFLYWAEPLMFEIGIGWIDVKSLDDDQDENASEDSDEDLRVAIAGAINVKYVLSSGGIKPYLQIGAGAGSFVQAGDNSDIGATVGGLYGGLGLLLGSPRFYAYGSFNIHANSNNTFAQFGIGFDI